MRCCSLSLAVLICALIAPSVQAGVQAGDVHGTVIIEHRLTKRKVTTSADLYARGTPVQLAKDQQQDPLAFERTHVVVYLEGNQPSQPIVAELSQKDRRFTPDLVVIPAGSSVSFPNLDSIFHNVFSLSSTKSFDLGDYPKGHTRVVKFPKPGIVFVDCHLHSNMSAVIVVTPNRWATKADASGHFSLPNIPPGTYTIVAWHKAAGFFRKTIRVTENGDVNVEFAIPLDSNGLVQEAQR